jgi:hypothetical protein
MEFYPFIDKLLDIACSWFEVVTLAILLFASIKKIFSIDLIVFTFLCNEAINVKWISSIVIIHDDAMVVLVPLMSTSTDKMFIQFIDGYAHVVASMF